LNWAKTPTESKVPLQDMATVLDRTPEAVQEFLRRMLPPGQRPWREKPRWRSGEVEALETGRPIAGRSEMASRKYEQRRRRALADCGAGEHVVLTIQQVATDLGVSRATVYRLLEQGHLRRFKGGVAESSFRRLLRGRPDLVRRERLSKEQREWLALNGYEDPEIEVKKPSVRGLLK
jgi:transposase